MEEWRRKQAAVILIACLPPGYGSEIEPRKEKKKTKVCSCRHSEQLHRVDSLRDRGSEITFLCEASL